jgi:hypothetical protein
MAVRAANAESSGSAPARVRVDDLRRRRVRGPRIETGASSACLGGVFPPNHSLVSPNRGPHETEPEVSGIHDDEFQRHARVSEEGRPVSKGQSGLESSLDTRRDGTWRRVGSPASPRLEFPVHTRL